MSVALNISEGYRPPCLETGPGTAFQGSHYCHEGVQVARAAKVVKAMAFREEFDAPFAQDGGQQIGLGGGRGGGEAGSCPYGVEVGGGTREIILPGAGFGADEVLFSEAE